MLLFDLPRLPRGWQWNEDGEALICPCDHKIEWDGICPNGHKSPVLGMF
ncbi:hypothetical protein ACOZ38_25655 [Sphaerisporangium viridialbum]